MPQNSLSLIIICRKYSSDLHRKIGRYRGFVSDVIVVCGDVKTDNTAAAAEHIFYFPFRGNFSDLRNFALGKATTDWVLFLDTDEELSPELMKAIPGLASDTATDGFWFPRKTFISTDRYLKYSFFYPDSQLRLFRNRAEYRFSGAVHEQLSIPYGKTRQVPYDLLHYPTNPKYTAFGDYRNLLPYIHIQASEIRKLKRNSPTLILAGIWKIISLFMNGYFRGKGFLDGWAGFRATLLFSWSIGMPYILAGCPFSACQDTAGVVK